MDGDGALETGRNLQVLSLKPVTAGGGGLIYGYLDG